jgi:hypothetical protein
MMMPIFTYRLLRGKTTAAIVETKLKGEEHDGKHSEEKKSLGGLELAVTVGF